MPCGKKGKYNKGGDVRMVKDYNPRTAGSMPVYGKSTKSEKAANKRTGQDTASKYKEPPQIKKPAGTRKKPAPIAQTKPITSTKATPLKSSVDAPKPAKKPTTKKINTQEKGMMKHRPGALGNQKATSFDDSFKKYHNPKTKKTKEKSGLAKAAATKGKLTGPRMRPSSPSRKSVKADTIVEASGIKKALKSLKSKAKDGAKLYSDTYWKQP